MNQQENIFGIEVDSLPAGSMYDDEEQMLRDRRYAAQNDIYR